MEGCTLSRGTPEEEQEVTNKKKEIRLSATFENSIVDKLMNWHTCTLCLTDKVIIDNPAVRNSMAK